MDNTLERIARILLLHSSFIKELGLLKGKMGISIFSFLYARYTNNSIYEDFAGDLVDEIYEDIHIGYSKNFDTGLAGIAWGVEFLIQNNFIKADADNVLEELDLQLIERDVRKISDNSLNSGLKGIAYYVISRCGNKTKENHIIERQYIADLKNSLCKVYAPGDKENDTLIKILSDILSGSYCYKCSDDLLRRLTTNIEWDEKKLFTYSRMLGITHDGYAGIGLKLLLN